VCGECNKEEKADVHAEPKRFVWSDWFPHGAQLYTRTKLMRKSEKVTVPSYKWVVEDMCAECEAKQKAAKKDADPETADGAAATAELPAIATDGPRLR
jgi:hypothetical protein